MDIEQHINNNKTKLGLCIKSVLAAVLIIVFCLCFTACMNSALKNKNAIDICQASEPQSIDPGLNTTVDGSTLISHLFSGLAKWEKNKDTGKVEIVPDLAEKLVEPTLNADGTYTYTYKIIENAKWNDGKPVVADDFVFAWNRSASVELASDFGYMFDNVVGYDDIWADDPPADAKLAVYALDDHTLSVTTISKLAYWNEFLAFPVFLPIRKDVADNEGMWASKPETYISNGAYKMTKWIHNSLITLEKNEYYPFADEITMPQINFYLSDNSNNQLANFKNKDWELIKDIPTNEIASLKEKYPDLFHIDEQIGVYYISWRIDFDLSPVNGRKLNDEEQAEVRKAISLMLDRNYVVENICRGGQTPASTYIPIGVKEANGDEYYDHAGKAGDPYKGYYATDKESIKSNYASAIETLKKYYKFDLDGNITDFPNITYIYNTNEGHKAIAEYFQNVLSSIGIKLSLENQEWATFLTTKKTGNFTLCRNSWVADYNDAIGFLELGTSSAGNNDSKFGKGEHKDKAIYSIDLSDVPGYENIKVQNGTWAETYDTLVAFIKKEVNLPVRDKLMHKAEDLLMSTGCVMPVYYYTDTYLLQSNVHGFYTNPLGSWFFKSVTID